MKQYLMPNTGVNLPIAEKTKLDSIIIKTKSLPRFCHPKAFDRY